MKIHEYQAKDILARYGIPIQPGRVAYTPDEAEAIARELGGPVVIKAQVYVGGRGKAGGIQFGDTPEQAFDPKVRLNQAINGSYSARTNAGVAVWAGKVYVGTGDCRLVAIDAAFGSQVWEASVCDATQTGITDRRRW